MAFVCRLKQSRLKTLSDQLRRCYFHTHKPCSPNYTASRPSIGVSDLPNRTLLKSQFEYFTNVRFFAAPVQVKTKQEEKESNAPRLNEQITSDFVRLVMGEEHKVVSRRDALEQAKRQNLDLVEVQRTAKPPVCKIMDYHKERYKQQVKEKDRAKSKPEVTLRSDSKEVRFASKIDQKDLQMKADMAKRMMERGYRVKCLALGTEDQDLDGLLSRLAALIEDVAIVERGPEREKKGAHIIVRHVKFGLSKKGVGKKVSNLGKLKSVDVEKAEAPISPSMETPDQGLEKNGSAWSVGDGSDDSDEAFDFCDDVSGDTRSYTDEEIKSTPQRASVSPFMHSRPIRDPVIANTVPFSQKMNPVGSESRFMSEPRNGFIPKNPMDVGRPSAQDSEKLSPTLTNRRIPPPLELNVPLSTGGSERVEADASSFKNIKPPVNNIPKQPQSPARFGIFSSPKSSDAPGEHGVPAAAGNEYRKGNPNSAINRSPGQAAANPSVSTSNSPNSQRQGINKGGQGSWGRFSRDNSVSSRTPESQAESQR